MTIRLERGPAGSYVVRAPLVHAKRRVAAFPIVESARLCGSELVDVLVSTCTLQELTYDALTSLAHRRD
jgi:hypothetical protein